MKSVLFTFLLTLAASTVLFLEASGKSVAKGDNLVPASSCGKGLGGNVEINRVKMADDEQILQIVDHDRLVVCYGKTSPAGASTVSCQKFTEKKK